MPIDLDKHTTAPEDTAPEDEQVEEAPDDIEDIEDAGEGTSEEATEVRRRLSEAAAWTRPYLINAHSIKSLVIGSVVLISKTCTWVVEGDALRVFFPHGADKRDAKKAAAEAARKAKQAKKTAKKSKTEEPEPEKPDSAADSGHGEPPAWLIRLGGLGLGIYLIIYTGWSSPAWSVPAVAIPWCALAWMYSPTTPAAAEEAAGEEDAGGDSVYEDEPYDEDDEVGEEEDEEEPYDEAGEEGEEDAVVEAPPLSPEEIADRFRRYVEHMVAARWAEGVRGRRQGVHVEDMLTDLKERGLITDEQWDTPSLGAYLRALGIPLRDPLSLTVNGRKVNRVGVHYEELTRHLGRTPHLPPHLVPDRTAEEPPVGPAPATPTAAA
ncbi:hypothetical protein [Kitasatospora sp. HPMI-4]|uniref:hypothetical protein n=1 Tax=Kitasatospora sp. HPMI-4 TaxID=3448443 RepID=UPI003F1C7D43